MIGGGRVRLNRWQQAAVAVGSAVGALLDPRRADLIAALGETTGKPAFERLVQRMKTSPEGRVSPLHLSTLYHSTMIRPKLAHSSSSCFCSPLFVKVKIKCLGLWVICIGNTFH